MGGVLPETSANACSAPLGISADADGDESLAALANFSTHHPQMRFMESVISCLTKLRLLLEYNLCKSPLAAHMSAQISEGRSGSRSHWQRSGQGSAR